MNHFSHEDLQRTASCVARPTEIPCGSCAFVNRVDRDARSRQLRTEPGPFQPPRGMEPRAAFPVMGWGALMRLVATMRRQTTSLTADVALPSTHGSAHNGIGTARGDYGRGSDANAEASPTSVSASIRNPARAPRWLPVWMTHRRQRSDSKRGTPNTSDAGTSNSMDLSRSDLNPTVTDTRPNLTCSMAPGSSVTAGIFTTKPEDAGASVVCTHCGCTSHAALAPVRGGLVLESWFRVDGRENRHIAAHPARLAAPNKCSSRSRPSSRATTAGLACAK